MQIQKVEFESKGERLVGELRTEGTDPHPTIVMCHGFAGVKELLLPEFADAFARAGFTVLTFDYRGFGESGGEKGRLVPRLQVEDAIAALDFATTLPSVDETKIALWGTSLGGAIAIVTASEDERVRALSVQLTFGSGKRVVTGGMSKEDKEKFLSTLDRMEKKRTSTGKEMFVPLKKVLTDPQSAAFYERYVGDFEALKIKIPFLTVVETMALCPEEAIRKRSVPVHITYAENDAVNPASESLQLFDKALEPKKLLQVEGATHYDVYEGAMMERVASAQIAWFRAHL